MSWPTSTALFSPPRCVTRSVWSWRRWANGAGHHRVGAAGAAEAAEDAVADGADLGRVVTAAADAAVVALDKTTEQLDVLAEAGVVDAGGRGLLVLLDALSKTVSGHAPPARSICPPPPDVGTTVAAPVRSSR